MPKLLKTLYKTLVPGSLQHRITNLRSMTKMKKMSGEIISFYSKLPDDRINDEIREILGYLKFNPAYIFPYKEMNMTDHRSIEVITDRKAGLNYVMMDGKKLYFRKDWSILKIKDMYKGLSAEQLPVSPHRYLTGTFDILDGDVVVDLGAAEGNFALSIADKAGKLFLVEADKEWTSAMEATFAPWSDKVEIINKYASDKIDSSNITLDELHNQIGNIDFVKIDVEGFESRVLKGGAKLLGSGIPLKIAVCTYHKENDEAEFTGLLQNLGFDVEHSGGYMIYHWDPLLRAPYLRRGLIRASRK